MNIRHFKDIGFTAIATAQPGYVNYVVYEIEGELPNGTPLYHKADSHCHPDPVELLEESEPYLNGSVKWDGCSNWHIDEQDRIMIHGCCRSDLLKIGEVMARCFDWTKELLPSFEGE